VDDTKTSGGSAKGRLDVPFENPISSLPQTAQKILVAARKLLIEGGYEAMTLENVAGEAGVNKASIRYNFGNKAGLVIAVLDGYIHDECLRLVATIKDVPPEDVVATAMSGMRNMLVEADNFQGFFDILPHAFREPELRERMLALYKWWYLQNLAWLGLRDVPGVEQNETLVGLGGRALRVFGLLLEHSMAQLRASAGEAGACAAPA
jgi:AcrR family transcriptional regulator